MPEARIGTSGFSYRHWHGPFYPEGLAQKKWFNYYCQKFDTVELNVTFYRLQKEETFGKWRSESPPGFKFALKGSRFITHVKRLKDPQEPLRSFMLGAKLLGDNLGVVLWQLPPNFGKDTVRLRTFLKALKKYRTRKVFEFRNESWVDDEVISILKEDNACMCMADWPPFLAELPVTADFVYIRRHGRGGNYDTLYSKRELNGDAKRIKRYLREKRDVYIYLGKVPFEPPKMLGWWHDEKAQMSAMRIHANLCG